MFKVGDLVKVKEELYITYPGEEFARKNAAFTVVTDVAEDTDLVTVRFYDSNAEEIEGDFHYLSREID